jgi:putative ABC transport system permease protein
MNLRSFFLKIVRRRRLQRDLEAELVFHQEMAAKQENAIPLGHVSLIQEQAFDLWRFNFIENLWRDLPYALRGLRRSPAFVISVLLSLGLGIGINAAMFSLGVEFLFSEPSMRDASSLVSIRLGGNSNAPSEALEFLRRTAIFSDVVGENDEALANYNDGIKTQRVFAVYITKNYFTSLGVPMADGRGIIPSDPEEAVVLSYRFWRTRFNSDPSIVGRNINLDGRLCVVTGILPEHHRGLLGFGFSPDIYMPRWLEETTFQLYARLKPGMSISQARAALKTVAKRMDTEIPDPPQNIRIASSLCLSLDMSGSQLKVSCCPSVFSFSFCCSSLAWCC